MRYRLKLATWTVVREPGEPSPRVLSDPAAVARLAHELCRDVDDDREHFWAILLNSRARSCAAFQACVRESGSFARGRRSRA
jgi:hypothetical protein